MRKRPRYVVLCREPSVVLYYQKKQESKIMYFSLTQGLVRLFRPDRFDEVTLLAFVQSCDGVFKRLRYLRASVGNSTSIDRVLESIFNAIFNFFLFLTVLSVLKLNPWALLVSMSTVLVSFAFALGPTAAKFIEGMVMIAVR